ncbi:hypothetical protein KC335_g134 [Hortaea werneckii]|nr:hypothetical protein KC335_g134 [Hortaea werneckii]
MDLPEPRLLHGRDARVRLDVLDDVPDGELVVARRKGRIRSRVEEVRVRKWLGLPRILPQEDMSSKRIARPIRAWFLSSTAETSVLTMASKLDTSTLPAGTRAWLCGLWDSCEPRFSRLCCTPCEMISRPMKAMKTAIPNPANTSARSRPKGCLIELRFHTSKLPMTSTATQTVAPAASKSRSLLNAVMARDPEPANCT